MFKNSQPRSQDFSLLFEGKSGKKPWERGWKIAHLALDLFTLLREGVLMKERYYEY